MNCTAADTGGYDVEFAENILSTSLEDIKCAICLLILKEPLQANPCGHRFCKTCIERVPGFGYVRYSFVYNKSISLKRRARKDLLNCQIFSLNLLLKVKKLKKVHFLSTIEFISCVCVCICMYIFK